MSPRLIALLALAYLVAAAPATSTIDASDAAQLSQIGKSMSPDLAHLDYSVFLADMTPAQRQAMRDVTAKAKGKSAAERTALFQEAAGTGKQAVSSLVKIDTASDQSIKDLGTFAALAYCNGGGALPAWNCGSKCKSSRVQGASFITSLTGSSNYGFIATRPSTQQIVVSFRGSVNTANWIDNLSFARKTYPYSTTGFTSGTGGLSTHSGFLDAYAELRTATLSTVAAQVAANPGYTVVFTGHSLGGALAEIAAVDAVGSKTVGAGKVILATYEGPRVGNPAWASLIDRAGFAALIRVTDANDIVPHIPPTSFGFEHFGSEYWVNGNSAAYCAGDEDNACSNSKVPFVTASAHLNFYTVNGFFGTGGCNAVI